MPAVILMPITSSEPTNCNQAFFMSDSPGICVKQRFSISYADASEIFINNNHLCKGKFAWQPSCSAFSVSKRDINKVCQYIFNQPERHKKETFAEEYASFLRFYQHTLSGK